MSKNALILAFVGGANFCAFVIMAIGGWWLAATLNLAVCVGITAWAISLTNGQESENDK